MRRKKIEKALPAALPSPLIIHARGQKEEEDPLTPRDKRLDSSLLAN